MANFIPLGEKTTYTLYINSNDKVSGTNNNASFAINWDDFLPREYQKYKVAFNFQTSGGNYKDATYATVPYVFSAATIKMNNLGKTFSFDTATKSNSYTLGVIQRDIQTTGSSSNTLACYYLYNPPKTMTRPNQNLITILVYNNYFANTLLTDTNAGGTALSADMTSWSMVMEFIPIFNDVIKHQGNL